jgi:hypothetical protein
MQGGLFAEPDLKKEWLEVWEEFYRKSFYYSVIYVWLCGWFNYDTVFGSDPHHRVS